MLHDYTRHANTLHGRCHGLWRGCHDSPRPRRGVWQSRLRCRRSVKMPATAAAQHKRCRAKDIAQVHGEESRTSHMTHNAQRKLQVLRAPRRVVAPGCRARCYTLRRHARRCARHAAYGGAAQQQSAFIRVCQLATPLPAALRAVVCALMLRYTRI